MKEPFSLIDVSFEVSWPQSFICFLSENLQAISLPRGDALLVLDGASDTAYFGKTESIRNIGHFEA